MNFDRIPGRHADSQYLLDCVHGSITPDDMNYLETEVLAPGALPPVLYVPADGFGIRSALLVAGEQRVFPAKGSIAAPLHKREIEYMNIEDIQSRRMAPLHTPSIFISQRSRDIAAALNVLLADMFALYLKTKNFHWHMSGPHFHDYHLLLDEQADQIFATTDAIGERVRKIGGTTLRSVSHISKLQRVIDNNADYVTLVDMLAELRDDNDRLVASMRETCGICEEHGDLGTSSLLENWIIEAEQRVWYFFEATRFGDAAGR